MLDTIVARRPFPRLSERALRKIGFTKIRSKGEHHQNWGLNLGKHRPQLTYAEHHERTFLDARVTLPKVLYGSNVKVLNDDELCEAIELTGAHVSEAMDCDFGIWTACVGRADFVTSSHVGESNVGAYLRACRGLSYPRRKLKTEESSVYFWSKGRTTVIYGKESETKALLKKNLATRADVIAARGQLRLESRFQTRYACDQLAKKMGVRNSVANLLTLPVATTVLKAELKILTLDQAIQTEDARMQALIDRFGLGRALKYIGFLQAWDQLGDDMINAPGAKSSTLRRYKAELKKAGLLTASNARQLPPLRVEPGKLKLVKAA